MIDLTIMTVIGVILAFIGPFGSFSEPLGYRLVSWVGGRVFSSNDRSRLRDGVSARTGAMAQP